MKQQKEKRLLAVILLIGLITVSNVQQVSAQGATTYTLGVSAGTEIVYTIAIVSEYGLKTVLGIDWRTTIGGGANSDEIGAKRKYRIDWINTTRWINQTSAVTTNMTVYQLWDIRHDEWLWIDPDYTFNPAPTSIASYSTYDDEIENLVYKSPTARNDFYNGSSNSKNGSSGGWLYTPTPVVSYLTAIIWKNNGVENVWSSVENVVTHKKNSSIGIMYSKRYTYDVGTGIMTTYQIVHPNNTVIYEYTSGALIPGYELPILLGALSIISIGLIYIVMKKKQKFKIL